MGIRIPSNILRFFSIPHSCSCSFLLSNTLPSSTSLSAVSSPKHLFAISSHIDDGNSRFKLGFQLHTPRYLRFYPYSSYNGKPFATSNQVSEIIALIRENASDLGFKLNSMNVSLSMASIVHIFHTLANERVSPLRFFHWLKGSHPELCSDPEIVSLVVNNCGLLGNYEAMVPILTEFNRKGMQLRRSTLGFMQVLGLDKDSTMECVRKIMGVLNAVGGAYQSSGIQLLIEMFSVSGSFEIAELVKRTPGMLVNHYNDLMRTMCKRGDYERAGDLLKEMKKSGCNPNRSTYNLLLSCLCKNDKFAEAFQLLETMERDHGIPDAPTFDIVVNFLCERRQFDLILKILDKMALKGIEPGISTHAVVIKSYFESGKYGEAHQHVVDSARKMSCSSNANYSLLATLHLKKGNVLQAHEILCEMMGKGLKPNFAVYIKIMKRLEKNNKKCLSSELLKRYSSLTET